MCITTNQKLSPRAGDSSRARPVGDEARGESGGIGSIASGGAARRPYSNQRSCRGVAVTKGEWLKAAKCREMFPLSRLTPTAPPQAVEPFGVLYKPLAKQGDAQRPHIFINSYARPPPGGFHMAELYFTLRRQYFTALWRNFTAGVSPLISFPLPLRWSRRGSRRHRPWRYSA